MLTRALLDVVVAALRIPVGALNSLTCKLAGHRPHEHYSRRCDRCGTNL